MLNDSLLVEALRYARQCHPCVVVCDTLVGLECAESWLNRHYTVYSIRGETPPSIKLEQFELFEKSIEPSYLVITKGVIAGGGFVFSRPSYMAVATPVSEHMEIQLLGRYSQMPTRAPLGTFIRRLK